MRIYKSAFSFTFAATLLLPGQLPAQERASNAHNLFEGSTDIGVTQKGSSVYDPATGSYRVTGGGDDMWGTFDSFHFSWVRLSGDATLAADVQFPQGGTVPHEKAVLIFRQSLDPGSAYADIAIHGDGHIAAQYRTASGGITADTTSSAHGSPRLKIEKKGNQFTAYAEQADGKLVASPTSTVPMHDPIYVGIGVCSHDTAHAVTVTFSNVKIERTSSALSGKP